MGGAVSSIVKKASNITPIHSAATKIITGLPGMAGGLAGTLSGENRIQGQERKIDTKAFDIKDAAAKSKLAQQQSNLATKNAAQAASQQQAARAGQSGLISQLQAQAAGKAPSLAEAQLKAASDRSLAQQLAAAAAQRGGNQAALQRALATSQASQSAQLAQDAAQMRIQEQNAARSQLADALQSQRGTDVQSQLAQQQFAAQGLGQSFDMNAAQQAQKAALEKLRTDQFLAAQGLTATGAAAAANAQANLLGGIAQGAGAAYGKSDKNAKKNIKESSKDVQKFLDALSAKKYEYKDTSEAGTAPGQRYGIMAQDLEKSPMGKSFVQEINGHKMVDTVQGFGAVLAAQSELNKRLKELEKKSSKKD